MLSADRPNRLFEHRIGSATGKFAEMSKFLQDYRIRVKYQKQIPECFRSITSLLQYWNCTKVDLAKLAAVWNRLHTDASNMGPNVAINATTLATLHLPTPTPLCTRSWASPQSPITSKDNTSSGSCTVQESQIHHYKSRHFLSFQLNRMHTVCGRDSNVKPQHQPVTDSKNDVQQN